MVFCFICIGCIIPPVVTGTDDTGCTKSDDPPTDYCAVGTHTSRVSFPSGTSQHQHGSVPLQKHTWKAVDRQNTQTPMTGQTTFINQTVIESLKSSWRHLEVFVLVSWFKVKMMMLLTAATVSSLEATEEMSDVPVCVPQTGNIKNARDLSKPGFCSLFVPNWYRDASSSHVFDTSAGRSNINSLTSALGLKLCVI